MRKLKLQMQLSIDGYVAGPNGEMDWLTMEWDDELKNYVGTLTDSIDCILLGRVLAEGFIDTWEIRATNEATSDDFARKMHHTPKVVFSNSLKSITWKNTVLAQDGLVDEVSKLKRQVGKDLMSYGGGSFVSNLIKYNLIDEYHLFINPVALGEGMSILKNIENRLNLELVSSQAFPCGIVVLCYKPAQ